MTQTSATADAGRRTPAGATNGIGLVHFGVPLGVAGLAGAWTAAQGALNASAWVPDGLWTIAGLLWLIFGALYIGRRLRTPGWFRADLHHPVLGPFAAYLPLIAVLLMTHFGQYLGRAAEPIVWVLVACSIVVAAQLFAHWLIGDVKIDYLHPGYFLPVVAAAFVSSIGLSSVGAHDGAIAAFGVGLFFWLVIGTIVTGRLITGGALPDQVKPTLAVLLVPPAVGGDAWIILSAGQANAVGYGFLGLLITLLLVQLVLIQAYRKVPVSISFWTFIFPIAASANFVIRWTAAAPFPGATAIAWAALGLATLAVATVAAVTLVPRR
ncbi:TDT family transporter [Gryllotalpicola protaetiae]|uniref:TDT family transporter n=1 Tax=Gryllotalpicola protaetiae TaxID=2419771 RepID=A0A387BIY1_9MICO|nr:TDT family transporter [Gryllotalpicola protaetiae]AYG04045.1 TDT family transporter [Gryllotalpicola protaetiae]